MDTDRPLVAGVYVEPPRPERGRRGSSTRTRRSTTPTTRSGCSRNPIETWVDYTFWKPIATTARLGQVVFPAELAPYNTYHAKRPAADARSARRARPR